MHLMHDQLAALLAGELQTSRCALTLSHLSREECADVFDGFHITKEADLPAKSRISRKAHLISV